MPRIKIAVFSVLIFPLMFVFAEGNAFARDLVLKNLQVIKVTPCDRQIRFSVVNQSAPGEKQIGPYDIQVYSLNRNKVIRDFPVTSQADNEILYFVVPASILTCDDRVRIKIDSGHVVNEINKQNNYAIADLERPKSGGLVQACIIDEQTCS